MEQCRESNIDFDRYIILKNGDIISKFKKTKMTNSNTSSGYVLNSFRKIDGKQDTFSRHRVVWFYFNGNIPNGIQVCHKDSNPQNNSIENLYLGTAKENMANEITRKRMEKVWSDVNRNEKIRQANKGKIVSEEQKNKQSKAMSGSKHPFYGIKRPKQSEIMSKKERNKLGQWTKKGGL